MKKFTLVLTLLTLFIVSEFQAQTQPLGMRYQAIARDPDGQVLSNEDMTVRVDLMTIHQFEEVIYSEIHQLQSSQFGLLNLTIGEGIAPIGHFDQIPWSEQNIWVRISIKQSQNEDFQIVNTSRLYSVPYAFYAREAGTIAEDLELKDFPDPAQSSNWKLYLNKNAHLFDAKLGTSDKNPLRIYTNGLERMRIDEDLGNADIYNSLTVHKALIGRGFVSLNVDKGTSTFINGTTVVGGADANPATFTGNVKMNKTLTVQGPALLENTLDVDHSTRLYSTLAVHDRTTLLSDLYAFGGTVLYGNFWIRDKKFAHLSGDLTVEGKTTLNDLEVKGDLSSSSLTINQSKVDTAGIDLTAVNVGMDITLAANEVSSSDKFVRFFDGSGLAGQIKGQNAADVRRSYDFIYLEGWKAVEFEFYALQIAVDLNDPLINTDQAAVTAAKAIAFGIEYAQSRDFLYDNLGVTYSSGNADYAEYLLKSDPNEKFESGDIVGVIGGKISKNTKSAQHIMVISHNPVVLGNMPKNSPLNLFEQVSFLGQVPVKVTGDVNIGDYIIPSGKNDGTGIAIHPDKMSTEQYANIVGVAWSESNEALHLNYINTAIGINANDLTRKLREQEKEITQIKDNFNQIASYLMKQDPDFQVTLFDTDNDQVPFISKSESLQINSSKVPLEYNQNQLSQTIANLRENPELIEHVLSTARNLLDIQGIDYNKYDFTKSLANDAEFFLDFLEQQNEKL